MSSPRDIDDQIGVIHATEPADLAKAAACVTRYVDGDDASVVMAMLGVF